MKLNAETKAPAAAALEPLLFKMREETA